MLGTRVILMGMQGMPNSGQNVAAEMLAAANHQIPMFWLLAFSHQMIQSFAVEASQTEVLNDAPGAEYPLLIGEKQHLLNNLERRYEHLKPCLSESDRALLLSWCDFLEAQPTPVFAIDTYELWMNSSTPDELGSELERLMSLLDTIPSQPVKAYAELEKAAIWQANNKISLAGYGW